MFGSRALRRLMLTTLGALLFALGIPAAASAAWSSAFISPAALTAAVEEPPAIAIDSDGDSFYVWQRASDGAVQGRTRSAAGQLGQVMTLSRTGLDVPEVTMPAVGANRRGDSLFAWLTTNATGTRNLIQGRVRAADGTLGPIQNLVSQSPDLGEITNVDVALDADGDAIVSWLQHGATVDVKARSRSAAGTMGATKTIVSGGLGGEVFSPEVEMDNGGESVFVWQQDGANFEGRIRARVMSPTGTLGQIRTLAAANATLGGQHGEGTQLAVNPRGDAAFTWSRTDATTGSDLIEGRVLTDDDTLKATVRLSPANTEVRESEVGIANNGAAVFAWAQKDLNSGKFRLMGRALSAANALGQARPLTPNTQDVFHGNVGVDANGNALFLWEGEHATTGQPVVRSRALSAAGQLAGVTTVTTLESEAEGLDLAVAGNGKAVGAWLNSSVNRVQGALGP